MRKTMLIPALAVFAACAAFAQTPPPAGRAPAPGKDFRQGPRGPKNLGRGFENFLANLPEEDREALRKQMAENPSEGRRILRAYFEGKRKKEMEKIMKLREAYLHAEGEEAKKAAYEALSKQLSEDLDRHLRSSERRIKGMEAQLAEFQARFDEAKNRLEKMKQGRDEKLQSLLRDLTDPEKKFDCPSREKNGKDFPSAPKQ